MNRLNNEEITRYKRHILLKDVGEAGQERIKDSKVLIVGAGGLGSPVALYLAAAGVGTIGIMDFDVVDLSNLQRQIIHDTSFINVSKVESAKKHIKKLNKNVNVITYNEALTYKNAEKIFKKYDIIVGATDNYQTRYLINEVCTKLSKVNIYGAIYQYEGQVSVFNDESPCYACLYPKSEDLNNLPQNDKMGVFGVLPGVIGSIQATEVIKSILGIGNTLAGKLLVYNSLNMEFNVFNLNKNSNCSVCTNKSNM